MDIPDPVRRTVVHWFGDDGQRWCDALPEVTRRLLDRWQLQPGDVLPGASHALVLDCRRADGTPAVLKLPFVDDENRAEADALRLYDGDGAVRLLDDDRASGALLLERLVPGTPLLDLADRRQALDIACGLMRRLRRPPPAGHRFPRLRDLANRWAVKPAQELVAWEGEDVLVNRDAHLGNVLAAGRAPWLLIDPKPVVGDPAFDGAFLVLVNLDVNAPAGAANNLVERIAHGLAVDARRLRGWAVLRALDNSRWASQLGDENRAAEDRRKAQLLSV